MTEREQSSEARGFFFHVTPNKSDNTWHVKEVKAQDYETYNSKEEAIKKADATEPGKLVCCVLRRVELSNGFCLSD
jgi:hypothetical protein